MPSVGFDLIIFRSKLRQMESKFFLNCGQSSKKWSVFSISSLQIKQSAPWVSFSQGTDALRPKLPMSLACGCSWVTRSGYSSAIDQNCWINETRLSNMHAWMRVAKLGPCVLLKDLNLISDNSFPICIGWKCRVVKPWFKILEQIVFHQHVTNTQYDTERCYSRVKVTLSSTFEQISDSWSHIGLNDKTPKKYQLFNGNFRSNRVQPGHLK